MLLKRARTVLVLAAVAALAGCNSAGSSSSGTSASCTSAKRMSADMVTMILQASEHGREVIDDPAYLRLKADYTDAYTDCTGHAPS